MAHRTECTGFMEDGSQEGAAGAVHVEGATATVRQSRRVQGLEPEFLRAANPRRRMPEERNGESEYTQDMAGGRDDEVESVSSQQSKRTQLSRSEVHRQKLIAELQVQEELDRLEEEIERNMLEKKILERRKKLIGKRVEIANLARERPHSEINVSIEEEMAMNRDVTPVDCQSWVNQQALPLSQPTLVSDVNMPKNHRCDQPIGVLQEQQVTPIFIPSNNNANHVVYQHADTMQNSTSKQNDAMLARIDKLLSRQTIPKELPFFNGEFSEWPMFITQYRRTTSILGLSEDENLVRLQKCLKGKARDAVLPILNIPENVERVIDTLEVMFGRSELIIKSMIQKVKFAESPQEGRPDTIIGFHNLVANLVATMKSLQKMGHMNNPQLLEDLVMKLPHQLRFQWCTRVLERGTDPNLEDFAWWLEKVALTYSIMPIEISACSEKVDSSHRNKKKTVLNINETSIKACFKCKSSEHKLKDCPEFKKMSLKDRWTVVLDNKLCIYCFERGHRVDACNTKKECAVDGCMKSHNSLLHNTNGKTKQKFSQPTGEVVGLNWIGHASNDRKEVLLRVLPVVLYGKRGEVKTYALLDEGATITMMDSKLATLLGAEGPISPLCIQWTNGMDREETGSQKVSIKISATSSGARVFFIHDVRTVENLSLPTHRIDMQTLKRDWPHLIDVNFESINNEQPMLLIGQDNILLTAPRKLVRGPWSAPVATRTLLGWVVHGNVPAHRPSTDAIVMTHFCNHDEDLNRLVRESFSTESFGVRVVEKPMRSMQDQRAIEIMEKTTKRITDRFETGLLWKSDDIILPDSKPTALQRLKCIERRMDKDPNFSSRYAAKIEEFVQKGYARELTDDEANLETTRTSYMSHFGVVNPNKPEKLRLVFDLAAKSGGVSLNDCLLKGPDLLNSLPAILWRFREYRVAAVGDVKEMFPQVKIISQDQHAQRFLWRGTDRVNPPKVFMMTSMVFGAACSPSSANWIKIKNSEEFKEEFPRVHEAVLKQTFMDDQLDGANSDEELAQHLTNVIEVYRRGGFCICNWVSNHPAVLDQMSPEMRGKGFSDVALGAETPVERVLGLRWRTTTDEFFFMLAFHKVDKEVVAGLVVPTKRQVLALTMSIFDPLGFIAPLTIKVRILLQCIWRSGLGWDDEITSTLNKKWLEWLKVLNRIGEFSINRCYHPMLSRARNIQLHMFVDASLEAFACVGYLRIEVDDDVFTAFVASKSKVAPLKPLSVPRLELQAAVLGTRLANTIKAELNISITETHFWSDSKTVLSWIRSDSRTYKQFVGHRIGEILETTDASDWKWVPTLENVADEATRYDGDCNIAKTSRWLCGPTFLNMARESWPKEVEKIMPTNEEMRKDYVLLISNHMNVNEFNLLPDPTRISKWLILIRATAWVYRVCKSDFGRNKSRNLTVDDLLWAKKLWWRKVQFDCFPEEVKLLRKGRSLDTKSRIFGLSAYMDHEGLIRMQGRTSNADEMTFDAKHPIILDAKHRATELMIMHYHVDASHQGKETVVNILRQKFWMNGLRSAVKKAFYCCMLCKRRKASPSPPQMAELPAVRLERQERPFMNVGMDFFGPFRVKVRRAEEKRYGVLFTCLSTRAIHLELAESLSTDSALNAIRRFIARRGKPKEILSDNATNFKGASRELREAVKGLKALQDTLVSREIKWTFIPPASPHMGGSWERLIRSVKTALMSTVNGKMLRTDVLQTLMAEAEHTVNSRPLTYVSVDQNDPESLTPNHFLIGAEGTSDVPGDFRDLDLRSRRQWRQSQRFSDHFWCR